MRNSLGCGLLIILVTGFLPGPWCTAQDCTTDGLFAASRPKLDIQEDEVDMVISAESDGLPAGVVGNEVIIVNQIRGGMIIASAQAGQALGNNLKEIFNAEVKPNPKFKFKKGDSVELRLAAIWRNPVTRLVVCSDTWTTTHAVP